MPKNASTEQMLDAASGLITPQASQQIAGAPPVAPVTPAVASPVNPPVVAATPGAPQVAPPVVIKSPLGDMSFGGQPVADVKLASFADVQAFAKDYVGIEIKDVQDFVSVFDKLKSAQEKAAAAAQLQTTVDTYKSTLDNLPKDVSLILSAAIAGEDHMPIIQKLQQKAAFDFEKPVTAHEDVALVNHYTGKSYTKETFDALDPSVQDSYKDVAKLKYKADQDAYANLQNTVKSATENRQKSFQASVESSISQMLVNNPKMDKAAVERVREIMTYDLGLFSKDKTYLPEAAEKIAYMTFGKELVTQQVQTIGDLAKQIAARSESQTTEKILMRSDQPLLKGGGSNNDKNVVQSIVDKETAFLKAR